MCLAWWEWTGVNAGVYERREPIRYCTTIRSRLCGRCLGIVRPNENFRKWSEFLRVSGAKISNSKRTKAVECSACTQCGLRVNTVADGSAPGSIWVENRTPTRPRRFHADADRTRTRAAARRPRRDCIITHDNVLWPLSFSFVLLFHFCRFMWTIQHAVTRIIWLVHTKHVGVGKEGMGVQAPPLLRLKKFQLDDTFNIFNPPPSTPYTVCIHLCRIRLCNARWTWETVSVMIPRRCLVMILLYTLRNNILCIRICIYAWAAARCSRNFRDQKCNMTQLQHHGWISMRPRYSWNTTFFKCQKTYTCTLLEREIYIIQI